MLDFLQIAQTVKKDVIYINPVFKITKAEDLMVRGGKFYAIWDEANNEWTTDYFKAVSIIDNELTSLTNERFPNVNCNIRYLNSSQYNSIDLWNKYLNKQMSDNYKLLDNSIVFNNTSRDKHLYSSKHLDYSLEPSPIPCYSELMSTLYSPNELMKIEWAIGSIVTGKSKDIQKFIVLIGGPGSGKSTVLKIINSLFDKYTSTISVKDIVQNSSFALEAFKDDPLVAIEDDTDISKIHDNTRLNSIVSHETIVINEKFHSQYSKRIQAFLFLGSNKNVDITDANSGLLRRLIDVRPTGNKINSTRYNQLMDAIKFELGGIAWHCKEVFEQNERAYDNYIPIRCMRATNFLYNVIEDNFDIFTKKDGITLTEAWKLYNTYGDDAKLLYRFNKMQFKTELMAYYNKFSTEGHYDDGRHYRNLYTEFKYDKFGLKSNISDYIIDEHSWIKLESGISSKFDEEYADCTAQYTTAKGIPASAWSSVITTLKDLDTSILHYVKVPINHIVIDFDVHDGSGEKSLELNMEEASKFPPTYTEVSKSGQGLHLHYIYTGGDPNELSRLYSDNIEVKVFNGNSSLRRQLTKCNDLDIATINSGLPKKEEVRKMVNNEGLSNERALRTCIKRNLNKEYHGATTPSVSFIFKILEDAYNNGVHYDVTDLRPDIMAFAANSTHQAEKCLSMVDKMKWKSDEPSDRVESEDNTLWFFDVEVFKNLFVLVAKQEGEYHNCIALINPSPTEIEEIFKHRLIGFNNRNYDNHICYAAMMGYNNQQLYNLSKRIISGSSNSKFSEAYNLSYSDIYDFSSAGHKQSLKKWQIQLGIHHQELGMNWDEEVPNELWDKVVEYCTNDVTSTEAVFHHLSGDWAARRFLADLTDSSYNDSTNTLTTRMIFGKDKDTKDELQYTDLRELFPGYIFEAGKSTYRGEEVGEGGYVYAEPGVYYNVWLLDIMSMHPHSILAMNMFGKYTKRFKDLLDARIYIKHKEWDKCRTVLDGKLAKYVDEALESGNMEVFKDISNALKTAINSVYGLTSAKFDNKFRDIRNVDNIVAKRGALFMINLKHEVQERGFTVAHIKTDSIKIPNPTPELIDFVCEYGKKWGYIFEHEATYEKMCLVDNAQYVAKYENGPWTAVGKKFQIPYIFKTLFSHEEIKFDDLCETKSVQTYICLDMNEDLPEGEHDYRFVGRVGSFCPIKPGCGGGELMANRGENKFVYVSGAKGWRWLEAETVLFGDKIDDIDMGYFRDMVDKTLDDINKLCVAEEFLE